MTRQTSLNGYNEDVAAAEKDGGDPRPRSRRCLSLTVEGPWGHFRRVDGNAMKTTYRIMPRTTVAGLLAAVVGYDRDAYYDVFARGASGVAIQPLSSLRTINLPEISLTTASKGMKSVNARGKVTIRYPDPTTDRQRSNYEVLVGPRYRIDVWTDDDAFYERLRDRLERGESYYTPSLGLSEFLAEVTYHGEFEAEPVTYDDSTTVVSTVPDPDTVRPSAGTTIRTERSPGYMERTSAPGEFSGRRTTGFVTQTFVAPAEGETPSLEVTGGTVHRVDGREVVFA